MPCSATVVCPLHCGWEFRAIGNTPEEVINQIVPEIQEHIEEKHPDADDELFQYDWPEGES